MRISSKGQITIPIDIRSKFGFFPDTEITFVEKEDGILLKKYQNKNNRGSKLILNMSGKSTVKMSTDTIMKLTRS